MRPSILDPLFGRAEALPGVGPKTAILLNRLLAKPGGEARAVDLLFHAPINVVDRRTRPTLKDAPLDTLVLIKVRVAEHRRPERNAKGPFKVLVEDETGDAVLVFFLANTDWIERSLPIGATRWVSGRLELYDGHRQIVHPDRVVDEAGLAKLPLVEPVHGLTEGLQQRFMQKAIEGALERLPNLPEWQNPSVLAANKLGGFAESLRLLHHPREPGDIAPTKSRPPAPRARRVARATIGAAPDARETAARAGARAQERRPAGGGDRGEPAL